MDFNREQGGAVTDRLTQWYCCAWSDVREYAFTDSFEEHSITSLITLPSIDEDSLPNYSDRVTISSFSYMERQHLQAFNDHGVVVCKETMAPTRIAGQPPLPEIIIQGDDKDTFFADVEASISRGAPSPTSVKWNEELKTDAAEVALEDPTPALETKRNKKSRRQRVHFSKTAQICTYETILSYHPDCEDGLAVACGWAHSDVEVVDMEVLEQKSRHRPVSELYLDFFARRKRLLQVTGLTLEELLSEARKVYFQNCVVKSPSYP